MYQVYLMLKRANLPLSREPGAPTGAHAVARRPRMAEYAEELWELMQDEKTHVYMCGLKGASAGRKGGS